MTTLPALDPSDPRHLPAVLDRWLAGWCLARGLEREQTADGWVVHVASDTRSTEHFVVSPSAEALERLAALAAGRPDVWVTVLGTPPTPLPPTLTPVTHDERVMSRPLRPAPATAAGADESAGAAGADDNTSVAGADDNTSVAGADDNTSVVGADDNTSTAAAPATSRGTGAAQADGITVSLATTRDGTARATVDVHGVTAATGQAAVVGAYAVFDRIVTDPGFRRRGHANRIMAALENWAVGEGAATGLLFASVEGRPLYTRRGWVECAPLVTYCGAQTPLQP